MFVLRRIGCLREPTKRAGLDEVKFQRDEAKPADLYPSGLRDASGCVFYNASRFAFSACAITGKIKVRRRLPCPDGPGAC